MAVKNIRKNFHLMIDGYGYAGQIEEFTPPKRTLKTEDFQGGGMNAPVAVSMGTEKPELEFSMSSYDSKVLSLFTVREGSNVKVTIREVLEDFDGTQTGAIHVAEGKITEIDPGAVQVGNKSSLKVKMALKYYKETIGSYVTYEIDVENMIQSSGGVDVLATTRNLLGI